MRQRNKATHWATAKLQQQREYNTYLKQKHEKDLAKLAEDQMKANTRKDSFTKMDRMELMKFCEVLTYLIGKGIDQYHPELFRAVTDRIWSNRDVFRRQYEEIDMLYVKTARRRLPPLRDFKSIVTQRRLILMHAFDRAKIDLNEWMNQNEEYLHQLERPRFEGNVVDLFKKEVA